MRGGWLAVLLTLVTATPVAAGPPRSTITWYKVDFPPIYIVDGEHAGEGMADRALAEIVAGLPGYDHEIRVAPVSRITAELERGANACTATLFRTPERRRFGYFAEYPTTFLPPIGIITRAEQVDDLGDGASSVSLEALLEDRRWTLGLVADRSYGTAVDRAVAARAGQENVFFRRGDASTRGLLEMVLKKRIDYTITYPWSVRTKVGAERAARFGFLGIEEAGGYARHYTLCTRNAWGREVVDAVDRVLKAALPTDRYRGYIETWLLEESRPAFRRAYDAFVAEAVGG